MINIKEAKELYDSVDESLKLNDACREMVESLSNKIKYHIEEGFSSCFMVDSVGNVEVMEQEARNKGFLTSIEIIDSYSAELRVSG